MPYTTWEEVAEAVQGEQRLKDMLLPRVETAEEHPYFDQQLAIASRRADVALEVAGFTTPLASVTDPLLKNAIIGYLIGILTQSSSSREPFEQALFAAAEAYFAKMEKGGVTVLGVVEDEDSTEAALTMGGNFERESVFDFTQADAEILGVFASLGRGSFRGSWRR